MKFLKWRIYSNERIGKIKRLLKGGAEDILVASELLLPEDKEPGGYPKYKILIDHDSVKLWSKNKRSESWGYIKGYNYRGINDRQQRITDLKYEVKQLKEEHFAPYEIKL